MGPEVEKQPGKIERLCFAWGPTAHPPTIIGLSVRPYVNPYTQLSIHTSMHPLTHQPMNSNTIHLSTYLTHLPIYLSLCLFMPTPSIHFSILLFKPILRIFLSVCLSVLPGSCCSFILF